MHNRVSGAMVGPIGALFLGAILAASAQAQGSVPGIIKERVNALVAQCARAGGSLGAMTGQGQFVIPKDFNGDGKTDFLVSEGNFPCAGRPALFRPDGLAKVQLYVSDGAGGATLAFEDRLLAYRVLDGRPAKLQIARRGPACGASRCGDELQWNASAGRFDEHATDGRKLAARPAAGAAGTVAVAAASAPEAGPAPGPASGQPAGPAEGALSVQPGAKDRFIAQCTRDQKARYPKMDAANLGRGCADGWTRVMAAGPIADMLLAGVPAKAGEALSLANLKARLAQVRWQAGGKAHRNAPDAAGTSGGLNVSIIGAPTARTLSVGWQKMEAEIPYDAAGALAARGAKVTPLGCYHFGPSEANRVFVVAAPGRPAFALTVYERSAAMGGQMSHITMSADLTGKLPTLAGLRAEHRDPPWTSPCPF